MASNHQVQILLLASCALSVTAMSLPLAPVSLHDLGPGYISNLTSVSLPSSTTMRLPFFFFLKHTKHVPTLGPLHKMFPFSTTFFCHVVLWLSHHDSGLSLNLTSHQVLGPHGCRSSSLTHTRRQPPDPQPHPLSCFSKCLPLPGTAFIFLSTVSVS